MGLVSWAVGAVEGRPLARLARPSLGLRRGVGAFRLRPGARGLRPAPLFARSLTIAVLGPALSPAPCSRPSSTRTASRSCVLTLYLGEPILDGLGPRAALSSPSETPSEAGEAELPAHLAFDSHTPVAVLNCTGKDSARVGFHNTSGRRLKLNLQWAKVDLRNTILEKITTTLSKTELEPGEAADLLVDANFTYSDFWEQFEHGRPEVFMDPLVVEIHSAGDGEERRQAEVELLFVRREYLHPTLPSLHLPFSPRAVLRLEVYNTSDAAMWLRLSETEGPLRVLHPERHFLVRPQREGVLEPLVLLVRLSRALRTDDLSRYFRFGEGLMPGLSVLVRLGGSTEADEADVAAVLGAAGREERQRLVRELSTAAFQRPGLPEQPRAAFEVSLGFSDSHSLRVFPSQGLLLREPPERSYLLLGSAAPCRLVWAAALPTGCPVELEETEGVLEPHSRGHLGLALLSRPDAPDCETLVTLGLRYAYAPAEEHGDAALPDRLADYLDEEERSVGWVGRFGVDLVLPGPDPDDHSQAGPLDPAL